MNRATQSAMRNVYRRQFCVLAARKAATPQISNSSRRGMSQIPDSSWAAEQLEKQGVKLTPAVPQELDVLDENWLETPDEKVIKLVDEILHLNAIEMCQFQRRFQRRLGIDRNTVEKAFVHATAAQNMVFSGHIPSEGGAGGDAFGDDEGGGGGAAPAEAAKEKVAFDLKLAGFDAKAKIKIIKEVRAITGLGLKEAKDLVEKSPCIVKEGVTKEEAEAFKKLLVDAGAEIELI